MVCEFVMLLDYEGALRGPIISPEEIGEVIRHGVETELHITKVE